MYDFNLGGHQDRVYGYPFLASCLDAGDGPAPDWEARLFAEYDAELARVAPKAAAAMATPRHSLDGLHANLQMLVREAGFRAEAARIVEADVRAMAMVAGAIANLREAERLADRRLATTTT